MLNESQWRIALPFALTWRTSEEGIRVACPWMSSPPEGRAIKEFHAARQRKKSLGALNNPLMLNAHNPPISMEAKQRATLSERLALAILETAFVNKALRRA